jgi:DNA-binding CsgD family transcriptional regulator
MSHSRTWCCGVSSASERSGNGRLPSERRGGGGVLLLTPKQQDVLRGVGNGLTNVEIADALGITMHAVEKQRVLLRQFVQARKLQLPPGVGRLVEEAVKQLPPPAVS